MRKLYTILMAVTLVFLFGTGYTASAAVITFELGIEFSEAQEPAGPPPWLTATFDDEGTPGSVQLSMSTSGLVDSEFVTTWDFNFSGDPTSLTILYSSGQEASSVDTGVDAFKPDGDGLFDIQFLFPTAEDDRFGAGETAVYTITDTGITASAFNLFSSPGGGQGVFLSAAHVQGIGDDEEGSGWVGAVPIPSTVWLFAFGLIGLLGVRRRYTK